MAYDLSDPRRALAPSGPRNAGADIAPQYFEFDRRPPSELTDGLPVRENLVVAAQHPSVRATIKELVTGRAPRADAVDEALEALSLSDLAEATPDELTQGQRKLVGVARALVGTLRSSPPTSVRPPRASKSPIDLGLSGEVRSSRPR